MSLKDAEEESTESDSNDDEIRHMPISMVESSRIKKVKKFDFVTEDEKYFHLIEEKINQQKEIEEEAKAKAARREGEIKKEELIDLLGPEVVNKPLSEHDLLDRLNDLENKKRKQVDDIDDFFRDNERLTSSVQYEDHSAGIVLNEPVLEVKIKCFTSRGFTGREKDMLFVKKNKADLLEKERDIESKEPSLPTNAKQIEKLLYLSNKLNRITEAEALVKSKEEFGSIGQDLCVEAKGKRLRLTVTWLTPLALQQVIPQDVDYKIMLTFLVFYETLLGLPISNFELINLKYPHILDPRLKALAADLYALTRYVGAKDWTNGTNDEESKLRLAQLQDQVPSSEPGALMNLVVNATFVSKNDEETRVCKTVFQNKPFFLGREGPGKSLLSVITSFGDVVSWLGDRAPFEESNQDMTLIIRLLIGRLKVTSLFPKTIYCCNGCLTA
uniref:Pescadillo homolog n=1 Tax=Tanacetum cinerariifolium TaxID=118510 RepID=A0A6L2K9E8_TANCI|nr:pescadillo homolog [Tanacetum cinerariifolium]